MDYKIVDRCRVCEASLELVLDLGTQIVATHFPLPGEALPYPRPIPLALGYCSNCRLPQLTITLEQGKIFGGYYGYRSGTNPMMRKHLSGIAGGAAALVDLRPGDSVCDIGANDGTLLSAYPLQTIKIAFEPSQVECPAADLVIRHFFPGSDLVPGSVKIVTAIAVFYDVEDPLAFLRGVKKILHPEGVFVLEVADFALTMQNLAFDAICHEHLFYYSFLVLEHLLAEAGLRVVKAERTGSNGGSVLIHAMHEARDLALLVKDDLPRVSEDRIVDFARRVRSRIEETRAYLAEVKDGVILLGASTKGMVFLQSIGLPPETYCWAEDVSPAKIGRVTPWGRIPIRREEEDPWGRHLKLVLPWHFLPEIVRRQEGFLFGGRDGNMLLIALPELMPVTAQTRRSVLRWFDARLGILPSSPVSSVQAQLVEASVTSSTIGPSPS